jgi:uncharacterized membrane protein YeiH
LRHHRGAGRQGKRVDLFGVVVLAIVTAVGGGTIRDVLLDIRPGLLGGGSELHSDGGGLRAGDVPGVAFPVVADAGPAGGRRVWAGVVHVIGVEKSLAAEAPGTVAVVLGVLTGVAGGILRDVLTGEIPLVFQKQIYLYATAAMVGCLVYLGLRELRDAPTRTCG